jgi:uncharacterized protein YdhG (YjbR/CyaY superfamily)
MMTGIMIATPPIPQRGSHHAQVRYPDRRELYRGQAGAARRALKVMRAALRKAVPGAEEVISYGIPALRKDGRIVVFFAAWKEHCALYPVTGKLIAAFKGELAPYELTHKGTVRFPLDQPVPAGLVGRIAKYRAGELAQAMMAKRTKAAKKPARVKAKR